MTTDIEKLIERLRGRLHHCIHCIEAADALTRLAAPLPAEVEEAIRCCTEETRAITFAECARLLESLARENARLVKVAEDWALDATGERDRLRAELASYKAATKLVVEYDRQQTRDGVKKGGA